MADASDDFFNSFGGQEGGSRSGAPPKYNANASSSSSAGAASYRAATSLVAPPPPPRPSSSASAAMTKNGVGGGGSTDPVPIAPTASVNASATANVPKPADVKVRPAMRSAASRPSRPAAGMTAARPLSRTYQTASNPAAAASSDTGNSAYYGGSVAYNAAAPSTKSSIPATTATAPAPALTSTTSGSSNQSFPYYGGAPSAPAAQAPSPYSNYGAAPVAQPTPAAPMAYNNYAAPAHPATSAAYNYGQSVQPTTATPQVMNPYLLSTTAPANAFSGTMDTNASFNGPMDTAAQPSMFMPQQAAPSASNRSKSSSQLPYQPYNLGEFEDEPPLLEELGVNIEHIVAKTRAVVLPFSRFRGTISDASVIQDADLAGPIALGLLLGGELMLSGKLQFGYIYGFGLFGCISMTLVLNFMSPTEAISVWTVTSILGYSLLPVNLLAAVKLVVVNLGNFQLLGRFLGFLTVVWCTIASTRLMEQGCGMRDQRYLIAYPIGLLYTAFVMITIF